MVDCRRGRRPPSTVHTNMWYDQDIDAVIDASEVTATVSLPNNHVASIWDTSETSFAGVPAISCNTYTIGDTPSAIKITGPLLCLVQKFQLTSTV